MECGNLVAINDCMDPPYLLQIARELITVNDFRSPITFMECGNKVTVNDLWSPYLIRNAGTL